MKRPFEMPVLLPESVVVGGVLPLAPTA